jgi:hypothetical protein
MYICWIHDGHADRRRCINASRSRTRRCTSLAAPIYPLCKCSDLSKQAICQGDGTKSSRRTSATDYMTCVTVQTRQRPLSPGFDTCIYTLRFEAKHRSLGGAVVVAFGCNSFIVTDRSCVRITPWRHYFFVFFTGDHLAVDNSKFHPTSSTPQLKV